MISRTGYGDDCNPKAKILRILPIESKETSLNKVLPTLLRDDLLLMKGFDIRLGSGRANDAAQLSGQLRREGGTYVYQGTLTSPSNPEIRLEGRFEDEDHLNDFLAGLAEQVSSALKSKVPMKKFLPYLDNVASPQARRDYAEGAFALDEFSPESLKRAVQSFEKAVQKDYNYVPAYLGLAESLAALAASEGQSSGRARVELEKAKVLNPYVSALREDKIESYLKMKKKDFCHES